MRMKVRLKVLLPVLPEAMGRKELDVEFAGETVSDLIDHLVARYGRQAKRALYDDRGQLDPVVQILLNGEEWVTHDRLDRALQDGDQIVLMLMLAGG
jgi:MoaD family protein